MLDSSRHTESTLQPLHFAARRTELFRSLHVCTVGDRDKCANLKLKNSFLYRKPPMNTMFCMYIQKRVQAAHLRSYLGSKAYRVHVTTLQIHGVLSCNFS